MDALLTSENFVKDVSAISDNVAGKYLRPSILEAQEIQFREVVGDALMERLKALVATGTIEDAPAYDALLKEAQYFLAYSAIVELAAKVSFKIANAGVVKTPDERVEVVQQPDMAKVQAYYRDKADNACRRLQDWLWNHREAFPELDACACRRLRANLYSAASCGVWLGGPRGKR